MKEWRPTTFISEQMAMLDGLLLTRTKVNQPQIDDQALEQFDVIVDDTPENNDLLYVDFWRNGYIAHVSGHVHYYDTQRNQLRIVDVKRKVRYINVKDIVHISMN
ncbi:YolD-like family protein [Ectobacillus funiculus]|uniref:YolD-like family protein n=1 Tax=Ectobacillus funiculus TaxID=137993 RepID=A0ABV5WI40_9BACI